MRKKLLFIMLLFCLFPLEVLASGQWELVRIKHWPNRPHPNNPDVKIEQVLKDNGISFKYSVYDRNNTKKWLENYLHFSWTFNQSVSTLKPDQKVTVHGTLLQRGTYLGSGTGGMLVGETPRTESHGFRDDMTTHTWGYRNNWTINLMASNNTVKDSKEFTVPQGPLSDKSPLTILFVTYLGTTCGVEYIYQWSDNAGQTHFNSLGKVLRVNEDGVWEGRWVCRADGKTYDAYWKHIHTGQEVRDTIVIESIRGKRVVLYRHGIRGRYYGTLAQNGKEIVDGTASWYKKGEYWKARVIQ